MKYKKLLSWISKGIGLVIMVLAIVAAFLKFEGKYVVCVMLVAIAFVLAGIILSPDKEEDIPKPATPPL